MAGYLSRTETLDADEQLTIAKLHNLVDGSSVDGIDTDDIHLNNGWAFTGAAIPDPQHLHIQNSIASFGVYKDGDWRDILTSGVMDRTTPASYEFGYLEGFWIGNYGTYALYDSYLTVDPGVSVTGNTVTRNDDVIAFLITNTYAYATGTSGKATDLTYVDGKQYFVFLIAYYDGTVLVYINDDNNLPDSHAEFSGNKQIVTRPLGSFIYDDGNTAPVSIVNYRTDGIYGFSYVIGDDGGQSAYVNPSVFSISEMGESYRALDSSLIHCCVGSSLVAAGVPCSQLECTGQEEGMSVIRADSSLYENGLAFLPADGGNSDSAKYYGFSWYWPMPYSTGETS